MVGTRGAAAAASSDGGRDRDAGGTSRAHASPSSPGAAAAGGDDEKGGNPNIAKVSHDDVVSNVHKNCRKSGRFGGQLQFDVFAKNKAHEVARLTWRLEH